MQPCCSMLVCRVDMASERQNGQLPNVHTLTQPLMQDIRDYELDYEAAKKAAASAAIEAEKEEERRIKLLEKNPLGEFIPEDEELHNIGGSHLSILVVLAMLLTLAYFLFWPCSHQQISGAS